MVAGRLGNRPLMNRMRAAQRGHYRRSDGEARLMRLRRLGQQRFARREQLADKSLDKARGCCAVQEEVRARTLSWPT